MWITFYMVHWSDPGYLQLNTSEYQNTLKRVGFFMPFRKYVKIVSGQFHKVLPTKNFLSR